MLEEPDNSVTVVNNEHPEPEGEWMSVEQTARYILVSRSSVFKMIREGKIPVVHVGRQVRISKKVLRKLMKKDRLGLT